MRILSYKELLNSTEKYTTTLGWEDLVDDKYTGTVNIEGDIYFFENGQPHNHTGPATYKYDGSYEWWIQGEQLSEQEFNAILLSKELYSELSTKDALKKKLKI